MADGVIITAPAVYNSSRVTYAAIRGAGSSCPNGRVGDLIGLKCAPRPPPGSCSLVIGASLLPIAICERRKCSQHLPRREEKKYTPLLASKAYLGSVH